jgi:uncharacterized protein YndB with AHSA1/START domain
VCSRRGHGQITQWFSPEGFQNETLEIDIRPGGRWRFVYVGPDGTRYENRMVFLRTEAPRLLEIHHGSDIDDDPARSRVTVTFDAQSNGKTVLTMRQLHPTAEQRNAGIGFGAVEIGITTLDKLALLPTTPTVYRTSDVLADPIRLNARLGIYTNFVNLMEMCGTAVPSGFRSDGMPLGVTVLAQPFQDATAARIANAAHRATGLPLGASSNAMPA